MIIKIVNDNAPMPERAWWISGVKHLAIEGVYADLGDKVVATRDGEAGLLTSFRMWNENVGQFVDVYIGREQIAWFCDWAHVGVVYSLYMEDGNAPSLAFLCATDAYLMSDEGKTIERIRARPGLGLEDRIKREMGLTPEQAAIANYTPWVSGEASDGPAFHPTWASGGAPVTLTDVQASGMAVCPTTTQA